VSPIRRGMMGKGETRRGECGMWKEYRVLAWSIIIWTKPFRSVQIFRIIQILNKKQQLKHLF
jgi:hypothetical protein